MIKNASLPLRKFIFLFAAFICLLPFMDAPLALILGFLVSLLIQHPFKEYQGKLTSFLLQFSVVGLGFGMNIHEALKVGKEGLVFTIASIFFTLTAGILIGKFLKIRKNTSTLISAGTAICGGSAIAAIAPVINADENETSVSLATIFALNSIALFLFPVLGHLLSMDQHQFGLWCAIAIHDTSSVVGASSKFGNEALKIATTIKLERALWIIPISLVFALINKKSGTGKIKIPYFIFLFILAIVASSYIPAIESVSEHIVFLAKKGLTLTLFLIGSNMSITALKAVGIKPLIQGVLLWILISVGSLLAILWM
ncbi:YeiH family protein [Chryseobacterium turcicum]|uniref:Sulfate exporter family transporter n=1 Tax=Chryseobacterium turcicum TaxID=2898076 RepID=A0A9Q3V4R9_9FLAO|nr:putative sulfate exporter family transporter [Chryseobacterium turcicum]MCD1118066.1 putative sulfate exporter family transporter [Chryseobacterium turcicum]